MLHLRSGVNSFTIDEHRTRMSLKTLLTVCRLQLRNFGTSELSGDTESRRVSKLFSYLRFSFLSLAVSLAQFGLVKLVSTDYLIAESSHPYFRWISVVFESSYDIPARVLTENT